MRFLNEFILFASLLFIVGIVAPPPSPDPINVPLPPSNRVGNTPSPGAQGVWNDDLGDTHAAYGNRPLSSGGIPRHAAHVASNQAKHPANADRFPVNTDKPPVKTALREAIIGNKPTEPGMTRDHKPPNLQKMPGLTTQQRKDRSTTKNLPNAESKAEWRLLGKTYQHANLKGATGQIQIHANQDPAISPTSSRPSLDSLPPNQRASKIPRPKAQAQPVSTSPRRLRSGGPAAVLGQPGPSQPQQQRRPVTPPHGQSRLPQPGFLGGTPLRNTQGNGPPGAPRRVPHAAPQTKPNTLTPGSRTPSPGPFDTPSRIPVRPKRGKRELEALFISLLRKRALGSYGYF